jgi:hypothetical protein
MVSFVSISISVFSNSDICLNILFNAHLFSALKYFHQLLVAIILRDSSSTHHITTF